MYIHIFYTEYSRKLGSGAEIMGNHVQNPLGQTKLQVLLSWMSRSLLALGTTITWP